MSGGENPGRVRVISGRVSGGHHHHERELAVDHPRRLAVAVGLNMALTAVQVAGGISAGSLALIADALHNFSDAGALIIALLAFRVARRPSDSRRTFGYRRAEVIGALINYTGLVIIGCYLLLEAALRALNPQPVAGWIVVWVATVALLVDVATVALTRSGARHSMNMRAAYLHNLADALTSLLVIGSGIAIILFGFYFADTVATLCVAAWVLRHALSEMGEAIRLLMNSVPGHLDVEEVLNDLRKIEGVADIHHAHLWQIHEHAATLDAHIVVVRPDVALLERVRVAIKQRLAERFGVDHSTLEFEFAGELDGCVMEQGVAS